MGNPFTEALNVVQKQRPASANPFLDALTPAAERDPRVQLAGEQQQAEALAGVDVQEVPGVLSTLGTGISSILGRLDPRRLLPSNLAAAAQQIPEEAALPLPQGTGLQQALGEEAAAEPLAFSAFRALPESVQEAATGVSEALEEVPITTRRGGLSPVSRFGPRVGERVEPAVEETFNVPVTSAVAGLAELPIELTSPQNLAILSTLGLGISALGAAGPVLGPLLKTAATGGLGTAAAVDILKKSPDFIQALEEGRGPDAARIGGNIITEAAVAFTLLRSARGSLGTAGEAARSARLTREADVFADTRGLPDPAQTSTAARQPFDFEIDPLTGEPIGLPTTPQLASPLRRAALTAPRAEPPPTPLPGEIAPPAATVPAGLGVRTQPPTGPFPLPSETPFGVTEAAAIQGQPLEGDAPVSARPAPIEPLSRQREAAAVRQFRTGIRGPDVPLDIQTEGEEIFSEAITPRGLAQLRTNLGGQPETPAGVSAAQAEASPFDFDERIEAFAGPEGTPAAAETRQLDTQTERGSRFEKLEAKNGDVSAAILERVEEIESERGVTRQEANELEIVEARESGDRLLDGLEKGDRIEIAGDIWEFDGEELLFLLDQKGEQTGSTIPIGRAEFTTAKGTRIAARERPIASSLQASLGRRLPKPVQITPAARAKARRARNTDPESGFTRFSNVPPQEPFVPEEIGNLNKKRNSPRETTVSNISDVIRNKGRSFIKNVIDRAHAIRNLGDAARKRGIEVEPHKDPSVTYDIVTTGLGGLQQEAVLRMGDVKFAAEQAGLSPQVSAILDLKGFQRAFQTLEENAVKAEQEAASIRQAVGTGGEAPEAAELLRAAKEAREKVASGKAVPQGYTPEKAATDLAAIRTALGPERFTEAENLANAVFDLNAESLELIRDTGLISQEAFDTLSARGREFIPLERILEDTAEGSESPSFSGPSSKLTLAQQTVIKRLRGSDLPTVDPYDASLRRFSRVLSESSRNVAAKTLVRFGTEIDPEGFGQSVRQLREGEPAGKGEGVISFLEGGVRQRWAVPEDIAEVMASVDPLASEIAGGAMLRFGQNLARVTLTSGNLVFSLFNVGRDIGRAAGISGAAARNPLDFLNFITLQWGQALKETVLKSPEFREFLRSGSAFSGLQSQLSPETFTKLKGELTPRQRFNVPARAIQTVEELNNVLEQSTKQTAFERLRKGKQKVDAPNILSAISLDKPGVGGLAKDVVEVQRYGGSPNFGIKGNLGPTFNLIFNFFTARLRGTVDDLSRMKRIVTKDQRTDPETLRRARNGLAWATLFGTALYVWNNQFRDEDGVREIDKVPNEERQKNFIFFLPVTETTRDGDTRAVYITAPKADPLRPLHAMIEGIYDQILSDEQSVTQTGLDIAGELSPVSLNLEEGDVAGSLLRSVPGALNPVLGAPLEQISNVRFPGVPIVPRRLEDVASTEQTRPTTSPTVAGVARGLDAAQRKTAEVLFGIPKLGEFEVFTSPLRLEQLTRRFGGGIADQVLGAVDFVARQGDPVEAARDVFGLRQRIRRVPLIGPIASRFIGSGRNRIRERKLRDLFSLAGDAREVSNTFGNLERDRPERSNGYILGDKKRLPLLLSNGELMTLTRDIAATRRAMDAVARDADIDRPTKVGQLRQMNALLRELLDVEKSLSARVDKIAGLDLTDEQVIQILELDRETKGRERRNITTGLIGQQPN